MQYGPPDVTEKGFSKEKRESLRDSDIFDSRNPKIMDKKYTTAAGLNPYFNDQSQKKDAFSSVLGFDKSKMDSASPYQEKSQGNQRRNQTQGGRRPVFKSLKERREEMHIKFYQTVSNQPFSSSQSKGALRQSMATGLGSSNNVAFGSSANMQSTQQSFALSAQHKTRKLGGNVNVGLPAVALGNQRGLQHAGSNTELRSIAAPNGHVLSFQNPESTLRGAKDHTQLGKAPDSGEVRQIPLSKEIHELSDQVAKKQVYDGLKLVEKKRLSAEY